jgi:hypothetical protein
MISKKSEVGAYYWPPQWTCEEHMSKMNNAEKQDLSSDKHGFTIRTLKRWKFSNANYAST